jgi:hypothetical protein
LLPRDAFPDEREDLMVIIDRSCVALALVAVSCATVSAQAFDPGKTRLGQTVVVRDASGFETRGVVQGSAQTPQTPPAPHEVPVFRVQIWGDTGTDFSTRVASYADLRNELEKGLPPLMVTEDPAEIMQAVRALAARIRVARAGARQGDIFSPTVSAKFKRTLLLEIDANTMAVIMDENPGKIDVRINGTYPVRKMFSTMPPNILAAMPRLPPDLEYRFLGRHLVLVDTRASVIIDRIPYAIRRAPRRP